MERNLIQGFSFVVWKARSVEDGGEDVGLASIFFFIL
jgi:hypothetical protein